MFRKMEQKQNRMLTLYCLTLYIKHILLNQTLAILVVDVLHVRNKVATLQVETVGQAHMLASWKPNRIACIYTSVPVVSIIH